MFFMLFFVHYLLDDFTIKLNHTSFRFSQTFKGDMYPSMGEYSENPMSDMMMMGNQLI